MNFTNNNLPFYEFFEHTIHTIKNIDIFLWMDYAIVEILSELNRNYLQCIVEMIS